jgi:NADPH:quinone reductase-like Zn-dependent oxidoreductase
MKILALDGYDGLASLRLADTAVPELGPRDVLINVHAASLNPIDARITRGYLRGRVDFTLPHVLGRDCSGVVAKVGAEVAGFAPGDEVYAVADQKRWGTHAAQVAIDAASVARRPDGLEHVSAASLPIAGLSALAGLVTVGGLMGGQRVLIHAGAGGVGSFAVQLAKHLGATVATTASSANHDYVRGLGADIAIDYAKDDFADQLEGYDLVFDVIGGEVRHRSFRVLRPGGTIAHLSAPPMTQPVPRDDVTVKPVAVGYDTRQLDQIGKLVCDGAVRPTINAVFPFSDAVKAYELMSSGHVRGKIVLDMRTTD